jgi:DNA (cytosine-5)-methyltransferase 1
MNDIQKQENLRLMYIDYVVERLMAEDGQGAIIDLFAGGGGASEGIKAVFGRDPDIAVNHDPDAIAMHQVNHKNTTHYTSDVFEVDPLSVVPGCPIDLLWASPACTHFSKARGSTPVCKQLRSLAWVVVKWAKLRCPRMIFLENVEEFADWCPVNQEGYPVKEKKGETFKRFVASLETLGYDVEWKVLSADDYGAPTIRKRLFMVARCDGLPIVWAEPTHGDPSSKEFKNGNLKPWHSAAEITNFLIPSHSIFMGTDEIKAQKLRIRRPLQETSLRRIGKGLEKYVLTCKHPFVVTKDNIQADGSIDSAWIVKYYNNASNPNQVMGSDMRSPLPTITTVDHNALATVSFTPFVSTYFGENRVKGKKVADGRGSKITDPLSTITSGGMRHALVTPLLIGIDNKSSKGCSWSPLAPLTTITTENRHAYVEASFLSIYYGNKDDIGQALTSPLRTITTKDRFCKVDIVFDKASHPIGVKRV